MKVMKFGGSSLKSGEAMKRVCKIIATDEELKEFRLNVIA